MSVLLDPLPSALEIDGVSYPIRTDYRTAIRILAALEDNDLLDYEKQMVMLSKLYKEMPPDAGKACERAAWFLRCGENTGGVDAGCGKLYDFDRDASYIYTAIRQSHGVDLAETPDLHWWKFNYFLFDLQPDCFFQRLISLRARRRTGKLTPEEREYCYKISDILDLPDQLEPEVQEAKDAFLRRLGQEK